MADGFLTVAQLQIALMDLPPDTRVYVGVTSDLFGHVTARRPANSFEPVDIETPFGSYPAVLL